MKEEYKQFYRDGKFSAALVKSILKSKQELTNKIYNFTQFLPETSKIVERTYCYINEISSIKICETCNNEVKFDDSRKMYGKYCSTKCANTDPRKKEQIKKTCIEKYGCENASQSDIIKNKIKQTNLERYGVEHTFSVEEFKNKAKKTNIEKYGYENVANSKEIKLKKQKTNIERYGVGHYSKTQEYKDKVKDTCLERFGVDSVFHLDDVKQKAYDSHRKNNKQSFDLLNDRYWLTEQYSNKSIVEIANDLNVTSTVVYNYLKKFNIETKIHHTKISNLNNLNILDDKEKIESLYRYKSIQQISNELNVSFSHICKKLISHGLKENSGICSSYENEVSFFIKSISNVEILSNSRKIIAPKELDIYIPDKKLAIEFNGLYWHSSLEDNKKYYHLDKTNACDEKGIQLLHIFENEWNDKKEIWKSVIKSKLGINERIYARKCVIKELSVREGFEFFERNHLQGGLNKGKHVGLYFDNELVCCISYGKSRFEKNVIEIYRFANALNVNVVGGFSKLLKRLPKPIISYANRRWSNGNLYIKNGFECIKITEPNYFYVKDGIVETRMKYQKHKLKDMNCYSDDLSEQQIMYMNDYRKLYDCGNLKFILYK